MLLRNKAPDLAIFFFLFFIVICLYASSLNNAFIYDDNHLIAQNLYIRQLSLIPRIFQTDSFHFQHPGDPGSGIYYRPLEILSYAVDYFFWGLKPIGYRLTNLFIHALNSFLAFLLIRRLFKDKILALLSAIFFAIHPIQACIVSLAAGRTNFLETFFMFSSLLAFVNYCQRGKRRDYFLSLLLFVFSIFSREGGLILPAFILLLAVFLKMDKKKIVLCLIPYLLVFLSYLILRSRFIPCARLDFLGALSWRNAWFFISNAEKYIEQLILPLEFQKIIFPSSIILQPALFCLSLLYIIYAAAKSIISRNKLIIFAVGFYLAGLLPLLKSVEAFNSLGGMNTSHYLYKSSLGLFMIVAYLIIKLSSNAKRFVTACLVMIVCGYSVLTIIDTTFYKDEWTYYHFSLRVDKNDMFVRVNLANLYFEKKMYARAMEEAENILAKEPSAWDVYLLLGNIRNAQGHTDKAIEAFRKAIEINPRCIEAFNNLALIYRLQGKDAQADVCFRQMLLLNPDYLLGLKHYCSFLVEKRSYGAALAISMRALKLDPADSQLRLTQGIILAELGHFDAAEATIKEALKRQPGSFEARKNLAAVYGNRGEFNKAITAWEELAKIKPEDEEIRVNLKKARELAQGKQLGK